MKSRVVLSKLDHITEESIHASLIEAISTVLDVDLILTAKKIIIKVNLCKPFPSDSGATVDIRVTKSLIKLILKQNPGAEIYVVESNSGGRNAEEAFKETGYLALGQRYENVRIVNLSKTSQITIGKDEDRRFQYFKDGLRVSSLFLDCDFFISVGKLKTHEFERFSGILKNQFGCLSRKGKERYHPYLSEVIGDISSVLKPDLCIIDGLIGMEGRGPSFGDPKRMDLMIVGNDPVSTDSVAARVMGIDPYSIPHLEATAERAMGEIELDNVSLTGERIEEVKSDFKLVPPNVLSLFRLSFKVRKIGRPFTSVGRFIVYMGRQLERLGTALYVRSFTEILVRKMFTPLVQEAKIPSPIHKLFLKAYLTLRLR
jgi:uncharacterized protein (DUF362 family)